MKKIIDRLKKIIQSTVFGQKIQMRELLENWLQQKEKAVKDGKIKPKTLENYQRQLRVHLIPMLGDYPVRQITTDVLQNFVTCLEDDAALSPATIRNIFGRLTTVFKKAHEDGIIFENPCTNVVLPKSHTRAGEALNQRDQEKLEAALIHENKTKRLAIHIALYGGLRISEIVALKWKDIDLENGFIYVRHSFQRIRQNTTDDAKKTSLFLGKPKTMKSVRSVPMNDLLTEAMKGYYEGLEQWQKKDELFVISKETGCFYDVRTIQRFFNDVCIKAGIGHHHFHDLRHTFATNAKACGVDIQLISELLGHAQTKTTMDIYIHPSDLDKKNAIQLMNRKNKCKNTQNVIQQIEHILEKSLLKAV